MLYHRSTKRILSSLASNRLLEPLEDRCLLSGVHPGFFHSTGRLAGHTIQFSQAPAAVQTGLDNLAALDGLTAPTPDQLVFLGNAKGIETYSIGIAGTGTFTKLTVDLSGTAIVAPTKSTTTFGALSNTAVTDEFNAIATALGLTAPAPTDTVCVVTAADLSATYTFRFAGTGHHKTSITLDDSGNPVGNAKLPLSVFSSAIQDALIANAPAGADPLTPASLVSVKTLNGKTTYSVTYKGTGLKVKITVDKTGTLTSLPSTSIVQFSTLPPAAQTELQTLATADGFVGTIDPTTKVRAYDEANGTIIFTIRVPVTKTNPSGTFTFNIRLSVDQNGNPTVPPSDRDGHHHGGCGGEHEDGDGEHSQSGEHEDDDDDEGQSSNTGGMAAIIGAFWHKRH